MNSKGTLIVLLAVYSLLTVVEGVTGCSPSLSPQPLDSLVAKGRKIFFEETFNGNGRTCGTCHPAENNFTLDAKFIASLPNTDPLFVAEFVPELNKNFENPILLRQFGLILENLDGFKQLDSIFTLRGIPHILGMSNTLNSNIGPHTGWSGDGAPGDASLRSFATGAVIQHFPKTLNRIPDVDFRLPTQEELDALEAFMLSLGRQEELQLPLDFNDVVVQKGQELFSDNTKGKCFFCHSNAGANVDTATFGDAGNLNFNTGVEELPATPQRLTGLFIPNDDGFGIPGDGTFNTPSLVEAADTGPFFHNNAIATIEGAVAFYNSKSFNNSPSGQALVDLTGSGIELEATEIEAIAAFLRVINALDNINNGRSFLISYKTGVFIGNEQYEALPHRASDEISDAIKVLSAADLHPDAVIHLKRSLVLILKREKSSKKKLNHISEAITHLNKAKNDIVNN